MKEAGSAREALIVEALGDMATLLDRFETVGPALASSADAVIRACTRLDAQAASMEARMAALAQHTQAQAVKHIAGRTGELMHRAAEAESRSMAVFARGLLHAELSPVLRNLMRAAQACASSNESRSAGNRMMLQACAVTAAGSSILTCAITIIAMTT